MPYRNLRVLLVEDHDFQRRIARGMLLEAGVGTVLEAADGQSALAILQAEPAPVDVAMVDLDLPGIDGVDLIRRIAAGGLARAVAVISALDSSLLRASERIAEASGLANLGAIEKPLTYGKLVSLLAPYGLDAQPSDELDVGEVIAALDGGELKAHFQPKVNVQSGHVVAVEALLRWARPGREDVPARAVAETLARAGRGTDLAERMLDRACMWRSQWRKAGFDVAVCVNTTIEALSAPNAVERIVAVAAAHETPPSQIVLEASGDGLAPDDVRLLTDLARLRLKGFGVALDDFGTGHASIAEIGRQPFTEIKCPPRVVAAAAGDARARTVLETAVSLARRQGILATAVGIENDATWRLVAEIGFDLAQGYLISRPVRGDEVATRLRGWGRPVGQG